MQKFAHSLGEQPEEHWEPLSHHLSAVGERAAGFGACFGAEAMVRAMGLLHDIGKASAAYQNYIRQPEGQGSAKGPDHSTAGAKEAIAAYKNGIGRLMAFGIAAHHGGLMDGAELSVRRDKAVGSRVAMLRELRGERFDLLVVAWQGGARFEPLRTDTLSCYRLSFPSGKAAEAQGE